jgi:fucose 4-O-acetylase-like acetyltransferase
LSSALPLREIDSRDALRAIGITAIVANHALVTSVHGGLNVLLVLSGMAFAQLCFGGRDAGPLVARVLRFARPLAVWSVVLCLFWFALFGRFEVAEIFMVSNWITTERVSKFPIWYTQVLLQMLAGIVLLLLLPGMRDGVRRRPVRATTLWLGATALLAVASQALVDTDHLADKLPHLHAWNFVLGWVLWAVLYARQATRRDRLVLGLVCVPLMGIMFLGLDVPGATARVWVAIPAVMLLIWAPSIRLPRALAHPVLLIGQSVLFIFFLHYPFLLAVRNLAGEQLDPGPLGALQLTAGMIGPVVLWAIWTAAQRTLAHARMATPDKVKARQAAAIPPKRPAFR